MSTLPVKRTFIDFKECSKEVEGRRATSVDTTVKVRLPGYFNPGTLSCSHQDGLNRPCHYFWANGGCRNGHACSFCHKCAVVRQGPSQRKVKAKRTHHDRVQKLIRGESALSVFALPKHSLRGVLTDNANAMHCFGDLNKLHIEGMVWVPEAQTLFTCKEGFLHWVAAQLSPLQEGFIFILSVYSQILSAQGKQGAESLAELLESLKDVPISEDEKSVCLCWLCSILASKADLLPGTTCEEFLTRAAGVLVRSECDDLIVSEFFAACALYAENSFRTWDVQCKLPIALSCCLSRGSITRETVLELIGYALTSWAKASQSAYRAGIKHIGARHRFAIARQHLFLARTQQNIHDYTDLIASIPQVDIHELQTFCDRKQKELQLVESLIGCFGLTGLRQHWERAWFDNFRTAFQLDLDQFDCSCEDVEPSSAQSTLEADRFVASPASPRSSAAMTAPSAPEANLPPLPPLVLKNTFIDSVRSSPSTRHRSRSTPVLPIRD